jgi:hypothetical protein
MSNHSIVYRALVVYANEQTGEIRVKIPSRIGVGSDVAISFIGRKKQGSTWVVPDEGDQIIVSADDENMTNIFWLQTSGTSSAQSAQTVEAVTTRDVSSTDVNKLLTSSATCTLTVTSTSGFEVGQRVDIVRLAGTLTVSQGTGATLLYTPANTLRAINSAASIVCIATNTYLLVGDLG